MTGKRLLCYTVLIAGLSITGCKSDLSRPNIILVMADDQGWGQMGYYNHPVLETPNLDAMAENGLRLDRFYAGAPNCSPARATVLTGRSNDRTAVYNHALPMRRQEKTIAQALKKQGYATAHFGKWHLNGYYGPGAPVLASDNRNPWEFGFDEWISMTNFYDMDPIMSRMGEFEEFKGGSSEIIVEEAIKFIKRKNENDQPFFVAIWYGSPHDPWLASEEDKKNFVGMDENAQNHYGELVDMDNSIGTLREELRKMDIADNTMVWFNSDNGGLRGFGPETVGGLRNWKGSVYEGGLRVPCVIEWPEGIKEGRISKYPAATMDIFPTIAEIVGLPESDMVYPVDGRSIYQLFRKDMELRDKPIPFRHTGRGAFIDNNYKLVTLDIDSTAYELYDLENDPKEQNNLINEEPETAQRLIAAFEAWSKSVENSIEGNDYPNGLMEPDPPRKSWMTSEEYKPYVEQFKKRPEYEWWLRNVEVE